MRLRFRPHLSWLALLILGFALGVFAPLRVSCADILPLEELESLLDSTRTMTPELLQTTLPAWAHYLQGGSITIRGLLQEVAWEPEDVVYSFRALEIFTWSQRAPMDHCPPDSILRFRRGRLFHASLTERSRQGVVRPLETGKQYWVRTSSLNLHPGGDLSFDGMFPIEGSAILIDYAALERKIAGGPLTTRSSCLRLPLEAYRACLAAPPDTRASVLLSALWSHREPWPPHD
jgi:hypothetical protein